MADIRELGNKITSTLGALIAVGVALVIGTWVGAEIYFEFQHVKRENIRIETENKKEIIRLEGRLDKITKRDREAGELRDKEASKRITTLELPGTDN